LTKRKAPKFSEDISNFLDEVQKLQNPAPFLCAGVAQWTGSEWQMWAGSSGDAPERRLTSSAFDLASITKSFFACLVARLCGEGQFHFETKLREVLPEVDGTWGGDQTVEALLSHRSGLRAHVELFGPSWSGYPVRLDEILRWAASSKLPFVEPHAVYSDLGYILVGFAVERCMGQPLDELLCSRLLEPWRIEAGSARSIRSRNDLDFIPTELQPGRGGQLRGVVHDDNAWALGGFQTCGHAGLFASLTGVLDFGRHVLDAFQGRLGQNVRTEFEPLTRLRPGGTLRMGFDGIVGTQSLAGQEAGHRTFGHLGFTGTSLWCDPDRDRVTVLLSNRVSPTRQNPRIALVRPKIHDFLWSC
jgi:CubicO group peptidase (beta-lactamase class C family)